MGNLIMLTADGLNTQGLMLRNQKQNKPNCYILTTWKEVLHEWQTALKEKRKYEGEFRLKRTTDGAYRWHHSQAIPFKDDHGNITAWIGTNIDIDDQKKELEKKDEFIGVASHELKTPLTSLKGYIQLMEFQENLSEAAKIYVTKATSSVNKLQHLIDELLDASKIKAGKLKFQ